MPAALILFFHLVANSSPLSTALTAAPPCCRFASRRSCRTNGNLVADSCQHPEGDHPYLISGCPGCLGRPRLRPHRESGLVRPKQGQRDGIMFIEPPFRYLVAAFPGPLSATEERHLYAAAPWCSHCKMCCLFSVRGKDDGSLERAEGVVDGTIRVNLYQTPLGEGAASTGEPTCSP